MRMARWIGLALAVLVLGAAAYVWFSGGSGEPSTEVTAPPITSSATTSPATTATTATPTTTSAPVDTTAAPDTTETTEPEAEEDTSAVLYRIDKAESSVRFEIDEILNGSPFRVVGVTTEVAGEVLIDFGEPAASQLGTIVINVRTLATDSGFRDRAIRGPILESSRDENEFATFEPTGIEGFPDSVTMGDEVPLRITGTFTLSGEARPVTFDTTVTVVSIDKVEVTGTATVLRSEFGLAIPDIPSVSDVADEILLVIDLVAVAAGV